MHLALIGTHHAERGAVTASALTAILARIQPKVIFAEIPQAQLGAWRSGTFGTLESSAVACYANMHPCEVIAVDSPEPECAFFQDWQDASRVIERTSPEYRRLMDFHTDRLSREGFAYLNSDSCIQAWTDIYREERETIRYIGASRFQEIYARVRSLNERREKEMLRKIHDYCASGAPSCSVLLVGAAHRGSIIDQLKALNATTMLPVTWDWSGLKMACE